jgi:hypothetical protein
LTPILDTSLDFIIGDRFLFAFFDGAIDGPVLLNLYDPEITLVMTIDSLRLFLILSPSVESYLLSKGLNHIQSVLFFTSPPPRLAPALSL